MHVKRSKRNNLIPEAALAAILDSSDDAIVSKNLDGVILSWNKGAEKMYGYTSDEILGKSVSVLVPPDRSAEIRTTLTKLKKGERIRHLETVWRKKDGTRIDVSLTISAVYNESGKIVGTSAIAKDISQEKRLRDIRNFLASIVDSSDDAILTKDFEGYILSWNKGAERIYGYSEKEAVGKHISLLIPPNRPDEISSIMARLKRGERIEHYETVRVKKDGTTVHISLTVSPVAGADGKIIAASAIGRDITGRMHAEEEKARLMKELNDSLAQKDLLLQEVYHRVKNNLQVVSSLLELRSRYVKDDPVQATAAFTDSINRIRAMSLVHEKLYKTESLDKIDFLSYLRTLTQQLVHSYAKDASIDVNLSGDSCFFGLEKAIPLSLIFNELITNSLKYAFSGSRKGEIDIHFSVTDKVAQVELLDNGIGLPNRRFFETSDSFGFRIVKLLAKQMKAKITQPNSEKGTSFKIEIPI